VTLRVCYSLACSVVPCLALPCCAVPYPALILYMNLHHVQQHKCNVCCRVAYSSVIVLCSTHLFDLYLTSSLLTSHATPRPTLHTAHTIRNAESFFFKAVKEIKTVHRLCLTGTPFVNRPEDTHSLLSFLEVQPLCKLSVFKRCVSEPIYARKEVGLATLRTTMAHVALRRTKALVESVVST
jgi:SNF2-related domain